MELRNKKNILFEERLLVLTWQTGSDDAVPFLELGGSRPKAVEGGCFPLQSLSYLFRNEKLSRNNKKLLYSDGRNCPEALLDQKGDSDRISIGTNHAEM